MSWNKDTLFKIMIRHKGAIYMLKTALRNCPVCQHTEVQILHHQKFDLPSYHILPAQYDVVSCTQCGFAYADTDANQQIYNEYYTLLSKYEDSEVSSGSSSPIDIERYEQVFHRIVPHLKSTSTILDIGCANGGLLSYLKNQGYLHLTGLDPSASCVRFMNSQSIDAVQGDLFDNVLLDNGLKYDVVIISHVFEHLYDILEATERIGRYVNEGGIVYIETPNAAEYDKHFIVPYYYFDVEHINHFTTVAHQNLFLQKSFEFIESKSVTNKVAEEQLYPAVYSLFRKSEMAEHINITFDDSARLAILNHLRDSDYDHINKQLVQLNDSQEPCVVWGAGQNTLRLLSESLLGNCNIIKYIDKDRSKQNKIMSDVSIVSPQWLVDEQYTGVIVISSALHSQEILSEIQEKSLNNVVIIL